MNYSSVYFLGIGGIGMSALARYFKAQGYPVAGYDLTPSPLTEALESEGIEIHYTDNPECLATRYTNPEEVLVIYTPAIPTSLGEFRYFQEHQFNLIKRSKALGEAVKNNSLLAIAGTHGKTTTSSILAHLMHGSHIGGNAFLGGIVANYSSNLLLDKNSPFVVVEADEYDRSFHQLFPNMAIITSLDPDHLDIYKSEEGYLEGFKQFVSQIKPNGTLIYKKGIYSSLPALAEGVQSYSYSCEEVADFYSDNIKIKEGRLFFDWHFPKEDISIKEIELGVPIKINVENATAAMAVAFLNGVSPDELRQLLQSFKGIKRRFERVLNTEKYILIDDYAHHPEELRASIASVRLLYPDEAILGIFQPHLYSRTKDFYKEFATALSELDEVILLPIYPAREEAIEGITSELILNEIESPSKSIIEREELVHTLSQRSTLPRVLVTLGAGSIDRIVSPLSELLAHK